jgi:preprotein translocase subunit SecE
VASISETPKKAAGKPNALTKVKLFFKRIVFGLINSFRNMVAELKKVTWPTKLELRNYSLVVFAFMLLMGIIIAVIDSGSALFVNWIIGI